MIEIENLYFKYSREEDYSIRGIDLKIEKGVKIALMGENGSGKTTLLKLISGILTPSEGTIKIGGKEPKPGKICGFSPEDPEESFFAKNVREEIEFFPKNLGLDYKERTDKVLKKMEIKHLEERKPYLLSAGEQRMVSLASIFSGGPEIIVLDEPTHSLHSEGEKEIGKIIRSIDKTIIFSTHSSSFAYEYADETILLKKGKVIKKGKAKNILSDKESLEEVGVKLPGIVKWAEKNSVEKLPVSQEEAVEWLKRKRQ